MAGVRGRGDFHARPRGSSDGGGPPFGHATVPVEDHKDKRETPPVTSRRPGREGGRGVRHL